MKSSKKRCPPKDRLASEAAKAVSLFFVPLGQKTTSYAGGIKIFRSKASSFAIMDAGLPTAFRAKEEASHER